MNIQHFKYAAEVAKQGSINKAAESLLMSQPNLSRAIKELEDSLGIAIFQRSAKGMVLTPDGEEFLSYARKILSQLDEIKNIYRSDHPTRQRLSVCAPRACYIAEALAKFSHTLDNNPAEIFYKETNSSRTLKNITNSSFNLGIIRTAESHEPYFKAELDEKGVKYETVTEFKYLLIMHKDSSLAKLEQIRFRNLQSHIEITHADPYVPSLPITEVKKEEISGLTERKIFVFERASQLELLAENHDTFMWVSPVPQSLLKRFDLVQRECTDNKKRYKDLLVYRNNYRLTNLDKAFINELSNSRQRNIKNI